MSSGDISLQISLEEPKAHGAGIEDWLRGVGSWAARSTTFMDAEALHSIGFHETEHCGHDLSGLGS